MLYDSLKIFHIFSAALLLTGGLVSVRLWRHSKDAASIADHLQAQTILIIVPLAILQLITGFTMISLKKYAMTETWIIGSVVGFVILIGSWFTFMYLLLGSRHKRLQSGLLCLCAVALLSMIFFMANKI